MYSGFRKSIFPKGDEPDRSHSFTAALGACESMLTRSVLFVSGDCLIFCEGVPAFAKTVWLSMIFSTAIKSYFVLRCGLSLTAQ